MMNQLKSIYNNPFKSSHSHPIHTCLATIASNDSPICGVRLVLEAHVADPDDLHDRIQSVSRIPHHCRFHNGLLQASQFIADMLMPDNLTSDRIYPYKKTTCSITMFSGGCTVPATRCTWICSFLLWCGLWEPCWRTAWCREGPCKKISSLDPTTRLISMRIPDP